MRASRTKCQSQGMLCNHDVLVAFLAFLSSQKIVPRAAPSFSGFSLGECHPQFLAVLNRCALRWTPFKPKIFTVSQKVQLVRFQPTATGHDSKIDSFGRRSGANNEQRHRISLFSPFGRRKPANPSPTPTTAPPIAPSS